MKIRCIFRRFKQGDLIALLGTIGLPECNPGMITCYQHIGQHGEGDPQHIMKLTRPAKLTDPDVKALTKELKGIGYDLEIRSRLTK